jgi:thioredoxin-related protein
MKNYFTSLILKRLLDTYLILYEANNPRNIDLAPPTKLEENYNLIRKYKIKSYPTFILVNHKGKMIGYKKGLILTEYYYYPFI